MKQRIVIRVSMPCERSRAKAMTLAARTDGVISMAIIGDARDMLEVVGQGVDPVKLVNCLRKKIGHAKMCKMEEVRRDEDEFSMPLQSVAVHSPPQCYPPVGYYYHRHEEQTPVGYHYHRHEEQSGCSIM